MRRRGFTLVELMLVVSALSMLAILFLVGLKWLVSGEKMKNAAEEEAKEYARKLHLEVKGIACTDSDSDGDGYVSCAIETTTGIQEVECHGAYNMGHGCRAPQTRIYPR